MLLAEQRKQKPPIESSPYRQFLIGQIVDIFKDSEEGAIVTHETISELIAHDTRGTTGCALVQEAKNRVMKEFQIVMASVWNVGWKHQTPEEIAKTGSASIRKARRVTALGIAKLMCADFDRLSNEDKLKHSTSMSVLGTMQLMGSSPTLSRVEKRLIANNTTDPMSEAQMMRFMAE